LNVHAFEPTSVIDTKPYDRLPQLSIDGQLPFQPAGAQFSYGAEYVSFKRSLRNGDFVDENGFAQPWYDNYVGGLDRAEGERMHLQPGISLPLQWAGGYVTPTVKYAYTRYDLELDNQASLVSRDG